MNNMMYEIHEKQHDDLEITHLSDLLFLSAK